MEADRGVDADALVAMSKETKQLVLRDLDGERLGEEGFGGLVDVRGDVHAPDGAFAVERVAADPVGEVGATIRSPSHADAHEAVVDDAQVFLTESVAVGDEREGIHLPFRELVQDEMASQVAVEGVAGLEEEASRTVGIIGDRRGDRERLIGRAGRHPDVLLHPTAVRVLVLVLVAPT